MFPRRQFLLAAAASSVSSWARAAETRVRGVQVISAIPRTDQELREAHDRAKSQSAELLPENEPFEIKSFAPFLTKRDEIESQKRVPDASCRRHAISVGLEMLSDDQKDLPLLSREQILAYLRKHFVSVQVRIYREAVSRALYLGPRCLAETMAFQGSRITKDFSPTVAESVNNLRSLGLFLPSRLQSTPSNLRTLVMLHKNEVALSSKPGIAGRSVFEYMFVRAREDGPDRLKLYAFGTSDERTKLNLLKSSDTPQFPADCSVRGAVRFTEYSLQGLYPKKAVTKRTMVNAQMSFPWSAIEDYAHQKHRMSALDSMSAILDAIIDGELKGARI